jgi:hypothetical protein
VSFEPFVLQYFSLHQYPHAAQQTEMEGAPACWVDLFPGVHGSGELAPDLKRGWRIRLPLVVLRATQWQRQLQHVQQALGSRSSAHNLSIALAYATDDLLFETSHPPNECGQVVSLSLLFFLS